MSKMSDLSANSVSVEREEGNTSPISTEEDTSTLATYWNYTYFPTEVSDRAEFLNAHLLSIKTLKCVKWCVFQMEETKAGKIHIQGCLGFTRTVRMYIKLRKMFPGIHIEPTGNWRSQQSYCTKDESRIAGPVIWPESIKAAINPWRGGGDKKPEKKYEPKVKETKVEWLDTPEGREFNKRFKIKFDLYDCKCKDPEYGSHQCFLHRERYEIKGRLIIRVAPELPLPEEKTECKRVE